MKTILFLYPFHYGAPGFLNRVLPMGEALQSFGYSPLYLSVGYGKSPIFWPLKPGDKVNHSSSHFTSGLVRIPSELTQEVSSVLYFKLGRFFPPWFRALDVLVSLKAIQIEHKDLCAVICQKPLFRTVFPSLSIANKLSIPAILDVDDYDISSKAAFLKRFDAIMVASRTLEGIFSEWKPLFVPNVPRQAVDDFQSIESKAFNRGTLNTIFIYPGTGLPKGIARKVLDALIPKSHNHFLTLVGFPKAILEGYLALVPKNKLRVYPKLPNSEVLELLDWHDISVCLDPNTRYGNSKSSIRLMESMSKGLAILSWSNGETGHIVSKSGCGRVVPYCDFESLRKEHLSLSINKSKLLICREKSISYIRELPNWRSNVLDLASLLNGLV